MGSRGSRVGSAGESGWNVLGGGGLSVPAALICQGCEGQALGPVLLWCPLRGGVSPWNCELLKREGWSLKLRMPVPSWGLPPGDSVNSCERKG